MITEEQRERLRILIEEYVDTSMEAGAALQYPEQSDAAADRAYGALAAFIDSLTERAGRQDSAILPTEPATPADAALLERMQVEADARRAVVEAAVDAIQDLADWNKTNCSLPEQWFFALDDAKRRVRSLLVAQETP